MSKKKFDFNFVEKQIRKKSFGVLSTVTPKGNAHSTGILYGVSPKGSDFNLYCLTGIKYFKAKNIQKNPNVSMTITFPHYWLRFAPASTVYFQALADFIPITDEEALLAFKQKRVLKLILKEIHSPSIDYEPVFIRIKPKGKLHAHGLGFSLRESRKGHRDIKYSVQIPQDRKE